MKAPLSPVALLPAAALLLTTSLFAQSAPASQPSRAKNAAASKSAVTVPVTLDHNRIVIDVYVQQAAGGTKRVRGLIDTGSTQLTMSPRVAKLVDPKFTCDEPVCTTAPPMSIEIGGIKVALSSADKAVVPRRPENVSDVMVAGMSPEVRIPAQVLKSYDVAIDYGNRQLTIGPVGSVKFTGVAVDAQVSENGAVVVPAKVGTRIYHFGIDSASPCSLAGSELLSEWHQKESSWPFIGGALGAGNVTGSADELKREMLQLPAMQVGDVKLHQVLVSSTAGGVESFQQAAHVPVEGLLGGEPLRGMKLGIDFAHKKVYFDPASNGPSAGLDVVGLTLRPEVDGKYTVAAVLPFEGQSSVPDVKAGDLVVGVDGAPVTGATMGQVWSLLSGEPGQTRKLVIERDGKRDTVEATVRRWIGATTK
jgi:hypothetical protein